MKLPFSIPILPKSAIYAFHAGDQCLYVGASTNLPARLTTQCQRYRHEAYRIDIYPTPEADLETVESRMIRQLKPRDNSLEYYKPGGIAVVRPENNNRYKVQKFRSVIELCRGRSKHRNPTLARIIFATPIIVAMGWQMKAEDAVIIRPDDLSDPDGYRSGFPFWNTTTIIQWAESQIVSLMATG